MSKYMDKWGDIWDRRDNYVIRRKDGNIGLWDNGKGLHRVKANT